LGGWLVGQWGESKIKYHLHPVRAGVGDELGNFGLGQIVHKSIPSAVD